MVSGGLLRRAGSGGGLRCGAGLGGGTGFRGGEHRLAIAAPAGGLLQGRLFGQPRRTLLQRWGHQLGQQGE